METEAKPIRAKRTPKPSVPTAPESLSKSDFYSIAKMFGNESDDVQLALIETSGRLQLVKLNIKEQPAVIAWIVRNKYAGTDDGLLGGLKAGCKKLDGETLSEVLTSLLSRVNGMSDTEWNSFWHRMFVNIAAPLLPCWSKAVVYSEYVYLMLVKPVVK